MLHFTCVFTVYKSTCLGVARIQRVKRNSEYDQEMLQSQITDQPMVPRERDTRRLKQRNTYRVDLQRRQNGKTINRGSYMSAHVLLNLLNELGKRDKMRGLPSIVSLFRNKFDKFNKTRARMLDSIYQKA